MTKAGDRPIEAFGRPVGTEVQEMEEEADERTDGLEPVLPNTTPIATRSQQHCDFY